MRRRSLLDAGTATLLALALALAGGTAAAEFPERDIHIIVPWKAGGGTDSIGRGFAEGLKTVVDAAVVVDNISGAGSATGTARAAKAKPDGYTLLLNGSTDVTAAVTFGKLPVGLDDFKFVGAIYDSPTYMLAHKDRGYASFQDFIAKAKANPGQLTVGVGGTTGAHMLMASAIRGFTGAEFRIIPYSGGADLKKALIGNQIDACVIHAPVLLAEIKAGLVNVLATGKPLSKIVYEPIRGTPTLEELGVPIKVGVTRALMVPKRTPDDVVAKLAALVEKAANSDAYAAFGQKFGFEPVHMSGAEIERQMRDEVATFTDIKKKYIDK